MTFFLVVINAKLFPLAELTGKQGLPKKKKKKKRSPRESTRMCRKKVTVCYVVLQY